MILKRIVILILFVFSFLFISGVSVYCQDVEEIQSLSRQKQAELLRRLLASDYSEDEISTYLKVQGYSDNEIRRFILEYRKARTRQIEDSQILEREQQAGEKVELYPGEAMEDTVKVPEVPEEEKPKEVEAERLEPYGMNIFREAGTLFTPDVMGPVDENYILGPGDEIIITLTGDEEREHNLRVNREGLILVKDIGQVSVNGLTLSELQKTLRRKYSKKFSGLTRDESATTFLEVSLGRIRSILVFVLGEVKKPGGYNISAVSTAFTALYAAGGPTGKGSLRKIEVLRNGKVRSEIDFYDYLLKGDSSNDIRLSNGDIVRVPLKKKEVVITGEIRRKARYELLENETLSDLLEIAGGLKSTAFLGRIQIDRIVPFDKREAYKEDRIVIDVNLEEINGESQKEIVLADLDSITVFPIRDEQRNYVYIEGAVRMPGKYQYVEEMTIKHLIQKAKGLSEEAYTEKTEIIRKNDDGSATFLSINLDNYLRDSSGTDFFLAPRDSVLILSKIEVQAINERKVSIGGQVKYPGSYQYYDNMKVLDLLIKGGGILDPDFRKEIYLENADLIRATENLSKRTIIPVDLRKILAGDTAENIELQSLDSLRVYGMREVIPVDSVSIFGSIEYPGKYPFYEGVTIEELILQAGGIKGNVFIDVAEVSRVGLDETNNKRKVNIINVPIEIDDEFNMVKGKSPFVLHRNDIVFLRENPQWELQENVEIIGEVKYPGVYSLLSKEEKLRDLIRRAGGLLPTAFLDGAKVVRPKNNAGRIALNLKDVMENENSDDNIVLFNGDVIQIPEIPKSVKVSGAVGLETSIVYKKGKKINYYVERAGGYAADADAGRTIVVQPNGISEQVKRMWFDPEPKPGSEIVVPVEREGEERDYFGFIRQVIATVSNAAVLIVALTRR